MAYLVKAPSTLGPAKWLKKWWRSGGINLKIDNPTDKEWLINKIDTAFPQNLSYPRHTAASSNSMPTQRTH